MNSFSVDEGCIIEFERSPYIEALHSPENAHLFPRLLEQTGQIDALINSSPLSSESNEVKHYNSLVAQICDCLVEAVLKPELRPSKERRIYVLTLKLEKLKTTLSKQFPLQNTKADLSETRSSN